jgi:uncharacterized damage-inducible protein DinB
MADANLGVNPRPAIMFVDPKEDPRNSISLMGDERSTLVSQLQWERITIELKCAGLDAADLARRPVESSSMSLLGIIRHLAEVERRWFRRWMAGEDAPPHFYSETDPEGDFEGADPDPDVVAESFKVWRDEIAMSDRIIAEAPDLDFVGTIEYQGQATLRDAIVHVIQEYARHVGHADLFREMMDGRIGI